MKAKHIFLFFFPLCLAAFMACNGCKGDKPTTHDKPPITNKAPERQKPAVQVPIPAFSADSAYNFIAKQVAFGPRVPNTPAHKQCAAWMVSTFKSYGLAVTEQHFKAKGYTGVEYEGINIIASYKPESPHRILIGAHWDSRFIADKDSKNADKPIDGADDGGSGVGIQLELARVLAMYPIDYGVDFILFDAEDQGKDLKEGEEYPNSGETWCLGSQHWAKNIHKPGYMPQAAILLDIVGGENPRFCKEGLSSQAAPQLLNKVWTLAQSMGHGSMFVDQPIPGITDDHFFVIDIAGIPMIDIISTPGSGKETFPPHHHKHSDTMSAISKKTLGAVGQVMTAFIYRTYNMTI